ncbi:MAG TPA: Gfo/Idh/MocA family oxidoreductase [Mycobacteriales bacterium]|jgi:predicted dehydrogenase|nr:Gfo/Idh/MocA family oxidoreductase [Mycobacteriales bacterium]
MTRVLLLGFAGIGSQDHQTAMYLPAFQSHPEFTVAAVCTGPGESGSAAREAAARLDVALYDSFDQARRETEFEAVSIAVALDQRAAVIAEVLRAGKHVLADKPLAASLAETGQLAAEVERSDRVLVPAHHLRLGGAVQSAVAAIAGGRIGLPWNVQADFFVGGGDPAPSGELVNLALYPVDVLHAMLGLAPVRVFARSGRYWNSEVEDFVALMIDYENGVTGTVTVGRTSTGSGGAVMLHRYRASGTHGVLVTDATRPALSVRTAVGVESRWRGGSTVDALLNVLHGGIAAGRPQLTVADAVHTQTVIDAAQRSLRSGLPERSHA